KGSERVAEVGARFTLDALPGKQMAIDAELRAGSIDASEARTRRRALTRESQFYGAMDGAMKFVKGDVIASLLIALINLLGGLTIGVLQRGISPELALKRYGLLTIGDGLVTQIPSLVLATAAGILVTRVASEEAEKPLGSELAEQLLSQPRALRIAAGFIVALALVPGLPALPFLVIGGLLLAGSRARARSLRAQALAAAAAPFQRRNSAEEPNFVPVVVPWGFELSRDLFEASEATNSPNSAIRAAMESLREQLFRELGVPLPRGGLTLAPDLPARTVRLSLREIPTATLDVPAPLANAQLNEFIVATVLPKLRSRASEFIGLAETQNLLDQLEQIAPASVRQVVPKPLSVATLAEVLRRLVDEGVSVRDLRAVLEALLLAPASERDPLQLAELVRGHLRRPITHALTAGRGELDVLLLDESI
ncbi:MAG TPA: flagellar biosynthesis protein FlhA, partial [Polyangiales bacterium]|nr:flagellar biosynthesis protein FlhA [Polyangiales bacterium]